MNLMKYDEESSFYEHSRSYIVQSIILILNHLLFHFIINYFLAKPFFNSDSEDYWCNRISLWICSLSGGISLNIFFSIEMWFLNAGHLTDKNILYCLFSIKTDSIEIFNISIMFLSSIFIFFLLPFSFFFIESIGFHKNSIISRFQEAFIVMCLFSVLITIGCQILMSIFTIRSYYLIDFSSIKDFIISTLIAIGRLSSIVGSIIHLVTVPNGIIDLFKYTTYILNIDNIYFGSDISFVEQIHNSNQKILHTANSNEKTIFSLSHRDPFRNASHIEGREEKVIIYSKKHLISFLFLIFVQSLFMVITILFVLLNILQIFFMDIDYSKSFLSQLIATDHINRSILKNIIHFLLCFYLYISTMVGFYRYSCVKSIVPNKNSTTVCVLIVNCWIFLLLSSSYPLFLKLLGLDIFKIIGFDLDFQDVFILSSTQKAMNVMQNHLVDKSVVHTFYAENMANYIVAFNIIFEILIVTIFMSATVQTFISYLYNFNHWIFLRNIPLSGSPGITS